MSYQWTEKEYTDWCVSFVNHLRNMPLISEYQYYCGPVTISSTFDHNEGMLKFGKEVRRRLKNLDKHLPLK